MAKKKSWFNLVKRFFLFETLSKTEKVILHFTDVRIIFSSVWMAVMNVIYFSEGDKKEMDVWKV